MKVEKQLTTKQTRFSTFVLLLQPSVKPLTIGICNIKDLLSFVKSKNQKF